MSAAGTDADGLTQPGEHFLQQLNITEARATTADVAMDMAVRPSLINNRGGLQGGLIATLVDIVAGCAALDGLPPGRSLATSDLSLHFLSAVTVGPAHAEATVLRRGTRSAVVRVEVYDAGRDVLAAVSTASFAVIELRPDQRDIRRADSAASG